MVAQQPIDEARNRFEREFRRFALRYMTDAGKYRGFDRAGALFLHDLDLPQRAVLIVCALHDQDRNADIAERVGDIPLAEIRIEPELIVRQSTGPAPNAI